MTAVAPIATLPIPRLDARRLTRNYGRRTAVNGVDLQLHAGEVLGLLGVNGVGKSTTLNLLTGNLIPQTGSVNICGADLLRDPVKAKKHLGYLPEVVPLYPDMTVDEYLLFAAKLHGVAKKDLAGALELAKVRCSLADKSGSLIGKLSKGYQQRVGIAQAMVHSPDVIVLDEPGIGLDPAQSNQMRDLIRKLGRDSSVIFSTHILSDIETTCSRVAILHQGKIVLDEKLDGFAARHSATLEKVFLQITDSQGQAA
ncbi:MAG: ABC transporter ATP-binding protein [Burkholderiales bacterium]